jgi:hypothetical protein
MSDSDIQKLESQFPAVSGPAFAAARERVLASGQSVLESADGVIYEVFPDGRRMPVKHIEPPTAACSQSGECERSVHLADLRTAARLVPRLKAASRSVIFNGFAGPDSKASITHLVCRAALRAFFDVYPAMQKP